MAKAKETLIGELSEEYSESVGEVNESTPGGQPDIKAKAEKIDFEAQAGLEAQLSEISRKTSKDLKKCKQVKIRIPKNEMMPQTIDATVGINGLNIQIMRDVNLFVPEPVYELLVRGGYNPIYVP